MGKQKKVPTGPGVEKGPDKVNVKSRTDCSKLVDSKASQSPIWLAQPAVQDAGKKLVAAGVNLATADIEYHDAMITVDTKRTTRETMIFEWNKAHDVYVSNVETYAIKPEDVTNLALHAGVRNVYLLSGPLAVLLKLDAAEHVVHVHVKLPPGMTACEIEVSPDPITPTSFKRLLGHGVKRDIQSPPPGLLWVRAATSRASEQSAFTEPVSILVK